MTFHLILTVMGRSVVKNIDGVDYAMQFSLQYDTNMKIKLEFN